MTHSTIRARVYSRQFTNRKTIIKPVLQTNKKKKWHTQRLKQQCESGQSVPPHSNFLSAQSVFSPSYVLHGYFIHHSPQSFLVIFLNPSQQLWSSHLYLSSWHQLNPTIPIHRSFPARTVVIPSSTYQQNQNQKSRVSVPYQTWTCNKRQH